MKAYTRTLMAKLMLKQHVGYMGKEMRVAVVHFHFQVANKNKGFRRSNEKVLAMACRHNQAHMSLFKVVPELHGTSAYIGGECRQRGVQVQLAKWYPWRVEGSDEPMADSCGIFMCVPCAVAPQLGMNILHAAWYSLAEHETWRAWPDVVHLLAQGRKYRHKARSFFVGSRSCGEPAEWQGQGKKARARASLIKERPCPS